MNVKPNPGHGQDSPVGVVAASVKPCGVCGGTDRNPSGLCRPCQAKRSAKWSAANTEKKKARKRAAYQADRQKVIDRSAEWVRANPDRVKATKAAWNQANQQKVQAYTATWRARHPEKRKQVVRAWQQRNPEYSRVRSGNRRARLTADAGRLSRGLVKRLFKLQRGKCACCGRPLGTDFHMDHVVPLALGGPHHDSNMQLLRKLCNLRKSAKHPVDYMQSKGKLL